MSGTTNIFGGTFLDVRGNLVEYNQQSERGLEKLLDATSEGAAHDSLERDPPPKCHPDTRKEVLAQILNWVEDPAKDTKILWLHGPAGAGKSSIAQSVAEACVESNVLAASFFFSRITPPRDKATHFFATIAYQIAVTSPDKRSKIGGIVEHDPLIVKKALQVQLQKLIIEPFKLPPNPETNQSPYVAPSLVVVDGLDECKGDDTQTEILRHLGGLVRANPDLPLCFLLVTRPEPHIRTGVQHISHAISLDDAFHPKDDVHVYLKSGFEEINTKHSESLLDAPKPWPTDEMMKSLVDKSGGMFIYAATVLRFIDDEDGWPTDRLEGVLSSADASAFENLDNLYKEILGRCAPRAGLPLVLRILGCVVVARGISPSDLEKLLELRTGEVRKTLRKLHSLLDIPDSTKPLALIHVLHASFADFIFNPERAGDFYLDYKECHAIMGRACMRDIYLSRNKLREGKMKYVEVNRKHHYTEASEWAPGGTYNTEELQQELETYVGPDAFGILIKTMKDPGEVAEFVLRTRWMLNNYDYSTCPYIPGTPEVEAGRKEANAKAKGNVKIAWILLMTGLMFTDKGFCLQDLLM